MKENTEQSHILKTNTYNLILLNSRYSLCPSGSGPNSIRFWESLAIGSIPILLADTLDLPKINKNNLNYDWKDAIIFLQENQLENINEILNKISIEEEFKMRFKCIEIYNYFKNNFANN